MNFEELDLVKFYCWQLGINTLAELDKFKKDTNANSNKELLDNLRIQFNRM